MRPPTGRAGISAKPGRPLFILLETLPSPQTDNRFCPIICTTWSCPVLAVTCSRSLNLAAPTPMPAALASVLTMRLLKQEPQPRPAKLSPAAVEASLSSFCCICFFLQDAFHSCAKSNVAGLASSRQKSLKPPNDSVVWARRVLSHETLVSTWTETLNRIHYSVVGRDSPSIYSVAVIGLGHGVEPQTCQKEPWLPPSQNLALKLIGWYKTSRVIAIQGGWYSGGSRCFGAHSRSTISKMPVICYLPADPHLRKPSPDSYILNHVNPVPTPNHSITYQVRHGCLIHGSQSTTWPGTNKGTPKEAWTNWILAFRGWRWGSAGGVFA